MTTNNIKYFDKYYVGLAKDRATASGKPLGFAVPDGTDSAAKKRKQTVDSWASGRYYYNDEKAPVSGKVYDNAPMTGFRLTEWEGRYVTDNKVVRVLDPRGFELEIYIPNLMDLILNCEIDRGLIKEELVWLRDGANNRLVRTADPAFEEAKRLTEAAGQKKGKPSLGHEVGDIISNTWGDFLYMGLMDVEFVVPRGPRVLDKEMTNRHGTHRFPRGGIFGGFARSAGVVYDERVFREYFKLESDPLVSVSVGRRHVYKPVRGNSKDEVTFRKSKMATLKVVSSGNKIPEVGENAYFAADYESLVYYDADGNIYTRKEFEQKQEKEHRTSTWPREPVYFEYNTMWPAMSLRVKDGPLQTAPTKKGFEATKANRPYRY
jgi:hypothetical protein